MIEAKKALKIILDRAVIDGNEIVPLSAAGGRVLAEKIYSDVNVPPFNRSAMDGFAIGGNDPAEVFTVTFDIPAGAVPKKTIKPGECARIMTGAMLPDGADRVIRVENTRQLSIGKIIIAKKEKRLNVARLGEDFKIGELVLRPGTSLRPQEIALLATVGKTKVNVVRKPKVGVISTGSELVEPGIKPATGQIRNSNGPMLLSQLKRIGIDGKYYGIARDDLGATKKMVARGLKENDILILSGGVSVGDYDFVKEVLRACGVKILFNKVAIKPGKPTVFGQRGKKLVFGLPGNPVSVLIIFELFVTPAISKIIGKYYRTENLHLPLLSDYSGEGSKRDQYVPVLIESGGVKPLEFHGSAHMLALTRASGIMRLKKDILFLKKGTIVDVRPI